MKRMTNGRSEITELDRRWAKVEAGEKTVPTSDVVRWLETWGSPHFKPWQSPNLSPSP